MSEEDCTKIIDNLKDVFEVYVYSDIAKNPPIIEEAPNYHHKAINLKDELDKVSKVNRKFYEFYQEIQKILTSTKDLHFNILAHNTPKGLKFSQYRVSLPFNFEIGKDKDNKYRIFIKENKFTKNCNVNMQNFIKSHLNIALKAINDIDPFDYIQNWSKYHQLKSPHAQFVYMLDIIPNFILSYFPVDYSDLYNEYEFDDNSLIKLMYFNNFDSINENDIEFNNYYLNSLKNHITPFKMPNFDLIKEEFLIFKGIKQKKEILNEEKIKWDIFYEEKESFIKCRYDKKNKVNVLVQNSFHFDLKNASSVILNCGKLFYSNEFPIIIIEDYNYGGSGYLLIFMRQIMQLRIADRDYESYRISNISKNYYNNIYWKFVDVETCKIGMSFEEANETVDYYDYNNLTIEHKRT